MVVPPHRGERGAGLAKVPRGRDPLKVLPSWFKGVCVNYRHPAPWRGEPRVGWTSQVADNSAEFRVYVILISVRRRDSLGEKASRHFKKEVQLG